MYEIKTQDYIKVKKIRVDGMEWELRPPGAGDEMRIASIQRRHTFVQKKVDSGTATEEDLDKLDEYEAAMLGFFDKVFRDGTEDNASVKKWVKETPSGIVFASFEEIKKQVDDGEAEEKVSGDQTTGQGESPTGESS